MQRDRSLLSPAFILHRRPYSNSSLLLECFTPHQGRFPAIAKGVQSARNTGAAQLQPFQPLLIRFSGRGEVKTLTAFEATVAQSQLEGRALFCGFYLNELLMHLLGRADPHERLFQVYAEALEQLKQGDNPDRVLRCFEIELLNELGYGLLLEQEAETGVPIEPEGRYHYELEKGPLRESGNAWTVSGRTLLQLAGREQRLDRDGWREARELMRRVIAHHLGGRALKSRELFQIANKNDHD
jgi:DNA repair protein RecO (recombination protein O)